VLKRKIDVVPMIRDWTNACLSFQCERICARISRDKHKADDIQKNWETEKKCVSGRSSSSWALAGSPRTWKHRGRLRNTTPRYLIWRLWY